MSAWDWEELWWGVRYWGRVVVSCVVVVLGFFLLLGHFGLVP